MLYVGRARSARGGLSARDGGGGVTLLKSHGWLAGLLAICATAALVSAAPTRAQNLDQGKSPAKLFANGCASCHRSPRGLAKGRFRLTLYMFLKEHYSSGSESAWTLASYLDSVDSSGRGAKRASAKPSHAASTSARTSLRPPAPIPGR